MSETVFSDPEREAETTIPQQDGGVVGGGQDSMRELAWLWPEGRFSELWPGEEGVV